MARCPTFRARLGMSCGIEWDEWVLVNALVTPANTVLEIGARFGTTSCVLSKATGNSGGVVSVELDDRVWDDLLHNRETHRCNFHVVQGTVSSAPMAVGYQGGYDTTSTFSPKPGVRQMPHFTFRDVEARIGRRFDTLLIDCEGCIASVLGEEEEADDILSGISLILIEHDKPDKVAGGYAKWFALFRRHGFQPVWLIQDTYDQLATWSRLVRHSAWQKGGLLGKPSCEEFAKRMRYDAKRLRCVANPERYLEREARRQTSNSVSWNKATRFMTQKPVEFAPPLMTGKPPFVERQGVVLRQAMAVAAGIMPVDFAKRIVNMSLAVAMSQGWPQDEDVFRALIRRADAHPPAVAPSPLERCSKPTKSDRVATAEASSPLDRRRQPHGASGLKLDSLDDAVRCLSRFHARAYSCRPATPPLRVHVGGYSGEFGYELFQTVPDSYALCRLGHLSLDSVCEGSLPFYFFAGADAVATRRVRCSREPAINQNFVRQHSVPDGLFWRRHPPFREAYRLPLSGRTAFVYNKRAASTRNERARQGTRNSWSLKGMKKLFAALTACYDHVVYFRLGAVGGVVPAATGDAVDT
mmetsp:Transcript_16003/g.34756  ORF Transcript_16003/g.34756 Transcript_16003/m.34756 type:complete len:583 (-) Transcript_16003:546-2294(-)